MNHSTAIKPGWNPLTIALMVLGFMVFWPLGLAMIAYILWGNRFQDMFRDAKSQFEGLCQNGRGFETAGRTGNVAFDEYRAQELKRLEEERRKLDTMRAEFDDFLTNLRRAKDQEEFDRFMRSRNEADAS